MGGAGGHTQTHQVTASSGSCSKGRQYFSVPAVLRKHPLEGDAHGVAKVGNAVWELLVWGDPGTSSWHRGCWRWLCLGWGSPPGHEGKESIVCLVEMLYIHCAFDLGEKRKKKRKPVILLMWARLNIVGNDRLKFLSGPMETAG